MSRIASLLLLGLVPFALSGAPMPEQDLVQLAYRSPQSPKLAEAVVEFFPEEARKDGSAYASHLGDFLFVLETADNPKIAVDDQQPVGMTRLKGGNVWVRTMRVKIHDSHPVQYFVNGKEFGPRRDVPAFGPDSYPQPNVPMGKVTEQLVHESPIYKGWKVSYWVYASPGVDPNTPAPLMVWQDGHRFAERGKHARLFTVTENLIHQKKMPPIVYLLVAPGYIGPLVETPYVPDNVRQMRSILYDTVNDDYTRMITEELLPKVEKMYKIRADGYSRGMGGQSSGGICSFTAAWFHPDQFTRVLSRIGSFTSIQWRFGNPDASKDLDGGNIYPFWVRKSDKKNIRVWMEDGANDLENDHGSWPLQNIQLANSLKMKDYDFRFVFGTNQHSTSHGDALLPEALGWLWRGYDPAKTGQAFEPDPAEKDKPYFRVSKLNRSE